MNQTLITSELSLPEGPLLLPDGTWLVTELDTRVGTVTRILPDGSRDPVAKTGRPNGLALERDGAVWVAESLQPALIRLDPTSGDFTRVIEGAEGRPLLWPNDVCFGPDGAIYMTDSGILVGDFLIDGKPVEGCTELPFDGGVIRYDPATGDAWWIDTGLKFTNGIAWGPDGLLYANETITGNVYRYRIEDGRPVGERETWGNVFDPAWEGTGLRGPDGMAFSSDGRLWCAVFGQGDVTVLDRDGALDHRFALDGASPTNVAFGAEGDTRLYIVEDEHGSMESRDVGIGGLPLFS